MFGFSTAKLIALAVAAAAILSFVLLAFHWKAQAADRKEKLTIICTATREASDNPKLGCGNVVTQIGAMGVSLKDTKAALARQNAAVADLGAKTTAQQAEAARASVKAQERSKGALVTSARLTASAHSATAVAKPCLPSDALKGAWQ